MNDHELVWGHCVSPRDLVLDGPYDPLHGKEHFEGGHVPVLCNISSDECIVHRSPFYCQWYTSAFAAMRGEKI